MRARLWRVRVRFAEWCQSMIRRLEAPPPDSGAAFERYLDERFPTPEARAEFEARVRAAAAPERNTAPRGIDPAQADEIDRELGIGPYAPPEEASRG